jgi:alkyldihydroxyacetonephosphate synthase
MHVVNEECSSAHRLDEALVERWLSHRNDVSALAPLWERGLVVDTIEVSGPWSVLEKLHQSVTGTLQAIEGMILASVHQSHAYIDGACLYFTFAGQPDGDTTAFYKNAWDTAISEVITNGGAISHHHGIGRNRARFVAEAMGSSFVVLEGLKSQLDPHNLMNPGVLGLGGPSW